MSREISDVRSLENGFGHFDEFYRVPAKKGEWGMVASTCQVQAGVARIRLEEP